MRRVGRSIRVLVAVLVTAVAFLASTVLQACNSNSAKSGKSSTGTTGSGSGKANPPPVVCDPVHPSPPPAPDKNDKK